MSLLRAVEVLTWSAWGLFALALAARLINVLRRGDHGAARRQLARPLVDGVRVDLALHGLPSTTSDDMTAAVAAGAVARSGRSSLVLDVDPLPDLRDPDSR